MEALQGKEAETMHTEDARILSCPSGKPAISELSRTREGVSARSAAAFSGFGGGRRKSTSGYARQSMTIVPRHPLPRISGDVGCVPVKSGQVFERIAAVELAGVDEAQIQVAHGRTVFGLEEQGVLAMQDRLLQSPFADVVVQRGAGHAEEQRQLHPVFAKIVDRFAQPGVWLHQLLFTLPLEPLSQPLHRRAAVFLMELQPFLGSLMFLACHLVVVVDDLK